MSERHVELVLGDGGLGCERQREEDAQAVVLGEVQHSQSKVDARETLVERHFKVGVNISADAFHAFRPFLAEPPRQFSVASHLSRWATEPCSKPVISHSPQNPVRQVGVVFVAPVAFGNQRRDVHHLHVVVPVADESFPPFFSVIS